MDKTININLGGTLFRIDEEAYRMLREYLQAIDSKFRNVPGGNETIEDIESRIAEIFQSQKGLAGVITRENVEAMIAIIGKPEEFGQTEPAGNPYEHTGTQRKRMYRNPDDAIIGGVCGGIGAYLNTDPVWIRILFVISVFFALLGAFVYLALWLVIPSASTDSRKKEMYGPAYDPAKLSATEGHPAYTTTSRVGSALNEIFRAIGKVLIIVLRILLIITGVSLVIAGFAALLTFILVFIFKYPGAFSTDVVGYNLSYLPDFLNYIVTPKMVPWIKILITVVVSIPLVAMIYGGVRMIFWFRARDGFVWLTGLIIWVMSLAALSVILFNEGVSFGESEKISMQEYFREAPDTLYIRSGRSISDLQVDNEISVPDEDYQVFISDEKKEVYIRTQLYIAPAEDNSAGIKVIKRSSGRNKTDARERAERLQYNYSISGKTLYLDEFFTIPANTKWSFDFVGITVRVPEGTIIYMDKTTERLYNPHDDDDFAGDQKNRFWRMTEDGPDYIGLQHNN
ncbi:MAG: PspC domain-containing protein [Bacteroidales bacterium]|nr:PspC domain-containing protein [Bacteroidales bacterium]